MLSPSTARMIRLPITQTQLCCPCTYRPRHTLIPIETRSRTPTQCVTQPLVTSVTIDRPLAALVYQLDSQVEHNPRRFPVRGRIILPIIRLTVECLVASGCRLRVTAEECCFESVHVGTECFAGGWEAAWFAFAVWTAEHADGCFEEDRVGDVAIRIALCGGVLRVGRRVARRCRWGACGGLNWWEEGREGSFGAGAVGAHYGTSFGREGWCAAIDCRAGTAGWKVGFCEKVLACCGWFDWAKVGGGQAYSADLVAGVPLGGWDCGVTALVGPRHRGISSCKIPGGALTECSWETIFDASIAATVKRTKMMVSQRDPNQSSWS